MEIKRAISRFVYRIEPKPEGGFIASCDDPGVPPLEAATRSELEQKIREKLVSEVESEIPALKISLEKKFISLDPSSAAGPAAQPGVDGGAKPAVEQWLTGKAVALIEKNLSPELVEQIKQQQIDGKLKVTVTKLGTAGNIRREFTISNANAGQLLSRFLKGRQGNSAALEPSNPVSASFSGTDLDSTSPITPTTGSSLLRFLAAALVLIGILFIFLYLKK